MQLNEADKTTALKIASDLLSIEAIKLSIDNPFTWSSGWKSPIYCDNRMSLSYPETRTFIKNELAKVAKEKFSGYEAVAGVATAGIPQGALLADLLEVPFIYVRSKPKGHGMENLIEGKVDPDKKVLIVEDLVSTGGSSLKAAAALRQAGYEVVGMLAIFTYGFPLADENFKNAGVTLHCLSNYSIMLEQAIEMGYITSEDVASLEEWRKAPALWRQ
ncbi:MULTISPECIES: orotate phosphoribosyltransferase [Roseivirga]|jgi:orotate phosphoribosyltransferase|uniref:Orotate phosphoribosyltransferase n=1 Tax=Roseivirga spongicola TaxID=333140 RepID=A0A150XAH4_9BACT|nr:MULTISPECIES: orotate phosphoribosyltransferase [Roseivirga]KYG75686.1 orotate phosphoribosyltransferase [Roseivirga spongicola]MBO6662452.1 orotate phosphoribosyltransferase [Roseivirga sp.]MBO6909984.1 orotate phosphoribosyltransferase [Roseivirga sp.]WPZ10750.1 orotate phosphoribosyltransferase [Roseivirga spongicola]